MATLIDANKLFEKVSEILDIPVQQLTNHHSLLEVINLLVKEIDGMEEHLKLLYKEAGKCGKPEWIND